MWRGQLKCCIDNCFLLYSAKIVEESNQNKIFSITWDGDANHELKIKKKNIKGKQRVKLAMQICSNGISNEQYQNIIFNKGTRVLTYKVL